VVQGAAAHLKKGYDQHIREGSSHQDRQHQGQPVLSTRGKFPLPKNPKVDIPVFKGKGIF